MISFNGKKKEKEKKKEKKKKKKKKKKQQQNCRRRRRDRCSSSLSFFFFLEELVFFFSGSFFFFFPYKSLCSRSEIIRSPSDLCSSLCSFISSGFDHNFIPVYWPKFTGKAETKRNCPNLQNRSQF